MIKIKGVDHVGIIVRSTEEVLPFYNLLGLQVKSTEHRPTAKIVFMPTGQEAEVELLEPTDPEGFTGQYLAERGEGLHHICFEVEDIDGAVKELTEAGVRMIDQVPRTGSRGTRIAYLHPDSTNGVLIELVGTYGRSSWPTHDPS